MCSVRAGIIFYCFELTRARNLYMCEEGRLCGTKVEVAATAQQDKLEDKGELCFLQHV